MSELTVMQQLPPEDVMFRAVMERDSTYDGVFFVAVRTTGVFCRPTCTARMPKRENVEFFASAPSALHAGFRPCRVCQPSSGSMKPPTWMLDLQKWMEELPQDARIRDRDLRARSIDPSRARRYFQKHFGMTFHAYQRVRRLAASMRDVRNGASVSSTPYRNGYQSDSGFRDAFSKFFGDPPSRAGHVECLYASWLPSPIGPLLTLASERGVCLVEFVDRRALEEELNDMRRRFAAAIVPGTNEHTEQLGTELAEYFDGRRDIFTAPLDAHGTPFQLTVWNALREIPFGQTTSYSALALKIGRPGAQRAVGRANGQNRIAIVIPCHRVVRENGELSGYGGGVWRKKRLLEHEQQRRGEIGYNLECNGRAVRS